MADNLKDSNYGRYGMMEVEVMIYGCYLRYVFYFFFK